MSEQKVVLVTGASSGIGQATARLLAQKGFTVFGTSRNSAGMEQIAGIQVLPLDVRSDESVNACVDAVLKRAGRLDILINNAGYAHMGVLEEVSVEEAMGQLETNLFGVMRMVKATLPYMRKQGGGQIINMGSTAGTIPLPFFAAMYSVSKFALAGYTENLRYEVKPFNIQVSLVEPAFIKTDLFPDGQPPAHRVSDYDPWRQRVDDATRPMRENAPGPSVVAECVLNIIENPTPRLHNPAGEQATRISQAGKSLPEEQFEQVMRKNFHLDA